MMLFVNEAGASMSLCAEVLAEGTTSLLPRWMSSGGGFQQRLGRSVGSEAKITDASADRFSAGSVLLFTAARGVRIVRSG